MKIKLLFLCVSLSVFSIARWSILLDDKIKIDISIPTKKQLKDIRKSYEYQQEQQFKIRLNNNQSQTLANILDSINFNSKLGVYHFVHSSFVPLIYSYDVKDTIIMNFFTNYFSMEKLKFVTENEFINPMEKTQYMYLNLEYIRRNINTEKLIVQRNKDVLKLIEKTLLREWKKDKGQIWSDEPFNYIGRKSRVASILLNKIPSQPGKSYFSAITDFELFCLIAGCSLAANQLKNKAEINPEIEEFIVYMMQILKTQCKIYKDGRWLLQPGVWKDFSDYLYAGNTIPKENLTIAKIDTISWDASHSARWPIFIHTLKSLFKSNSTENKLLSDFQKGLADQFMNKVVHQTESIPRFNNFMDGWNGIYRYNYSTMKQGYAPFTCNKHIFLSWWKILDDERVNKLYRDVELNYEYYQKEYKGEIKRQKQFFKLLISLN
jgi:hypothetical protein